MAGSWQRLQDLTGPELRAFDRRFRRVAKFYADENIEPVLIEILRDLGFDIATAREVGLLQRDDTDHYGYARQSNRILLSHDQDFLNDQRFPPQKHPGVVVFDIQPITRDALSDAFYLLKVVVRPYRELWREAKILIHKNLEMTVRNRNFERRRENIRYRLRQRHAEEWRNQ